MKYLINALLLITLCSATSHAAKNYLYQWDSGSGHTWPGWVWYNENENGEMPAGWVSAASSGIYKQKTFPWGASPRMFEKWDYANNNASAEISTVIAPSTSSGGSLRVYNISGTTSYTPGWWMWYTGEPLSDLGVANENTDRWSFYIKLEGIPVATQNDLGATFHIGTYLCKDTGLPAYGTGDGCPYEGPGNQHYYHSQNYSPGGWIHVELDQHPTHLRNSFVASNDPSYATLGKHYMESLHQFYMEVRYDTGQQTEFNVDEMYFYSTQDPTESDEPNQNDISITGVSVGYFPSRGKWEIGWKDESYETSTGENTNDTTQSTFEVRWSTFPITNANYNSATPITPEWFGGISVSGNANYIRRKDSWRVDAYTQFELPAEIVNNNDKIYFAIKDVSVAGGNAGSGYPWNRTDGHNAPSSNIHTIDYDIRPSSAAPTCSDGIQNGDETGVDCGGSCSACTTGSVSAWLTLTADGSILTSSGDVLTPAQ